MTQLGFDSDKIVVQPPGVSVNDIEYKKRISDSDKTRIVSVGRVVEKKGFDDLIKALAIGRDSGYKDFNLDIIGDGPMRSL